VGAFGEVQVMDWGLARELKRGADSRERPALREPVPSVPATETCGPADDETERSRVGEALGTPAYMPPEQARGDWNCVDARADVFALGGILCTILTGKPPYTGRNVVELIKRAVAADLGEAFARLDACGADPGLVKLAKWCLAPEPADRPLDAGTVTAILHAHRFDVDERQQTEERERVVRNAARRRIAPPSVRVAPARTPETKARSMGNQGWASATVSALLALIGLSAGDRRSRGEPLAPSGANECHDPTVDRLGLPEPFPN
jgi:serine/threonine protein kinase